MLDQLFTAENFRDIFDEVNRKGLDPAGKFFPNLEPFTAAIKTQIEQIRDLRKKQASIAPQVFAEALAILKADLATLKQQKSAQIDIEMDKVSQAVHQTDFRLTLAEGIGPNGKPVYSIDKSPEAFFVVKQLQRNINRIYKVKQSNRHDLSAQVRDTLSANFPFEIVRTDISQFYETVDRKKLFLKLDADQLLSASSKRFIKQLLDAYGSQSKSVVGVPRGVGVSAYLAELFLRPIDKRIGAIGGVVLYCRYVDDIVAIFARPPVGAPQGSYKDLIASIFADEGLSMNIAKTVEYQIGVHSSISFDYLGYNYSITGGPLVVSPSAAKIAKYKTRLIKAFEAYDNARHEHGRRAYRDLVARIKFLTGNTRLQNNKSGAAVGIFFNNSIATDASAFAVLDKLLKDEINNVKRKTLRKRLKEYKFSEGFNQRRFHNFSSKELQKIVRAWKHV